MQNGNYGKIMLGVGGLYTVRVLSSCSGEKSELEGSTVNCRARGAFKHNNVTLLAGDDVIIRPASENDAESFKSKGKGKPSEHMTEFVIDELCERKNSLIRPPLANLDFIFITMAAASPAPILTTVDKLICISEFNNIEPVIVITKCELDPKYADELAEIYEKSGFTVFKLSAIENIGVEPIDEFIRENLTDGKTAAFAGASGIGKSTLLNRLFPALELSTSEISRKIERGRHTTRKAELYTLTDELDCGYIADTPGFSMLDFARFDFFEKDDLPTTMREFVPLIEKCRYTKCSHTKEEGCAVLEALRDGRVARSRHESYCELFEILKAKKKW